VNAQLDLEAFRDCIRDNIALIKRAFTGDLIIPDFGPFCDVIDDIYIKCRTNSDGEVNTEWEGYE